MLDSEEKEELEKLVRNLELDVEVMKTDAAILRKFLKSKSEIT